jgi:hypothetical protein
MQIDHLSEFAVVEADEVITPETDVMVYLPIMRLSSQ